MVVTPHLGASTVEAQDKAGTTVAEMVRLALQGEFVPYAVNVSAGAEVTEVVRPFVPLAERLGALSAGLADGGVRSRECAYLGRIAEPDTRVLTLAILKGSCGARERAGLVRERADARRERGIDGQRDALDRAPGLRHLDRATRRDRRGAGHGRHLVGKRNTERSRTSTSSISSSLPPSRWCSSTTWTAGLIGKVGTILGEHAINIATMDVGRRDVAERDTAWRR